MLLPPPPPAAKKPAALLLLLLLLLLLAPVMPPRARLAAMASRARSSRDPEQTRLILFLFLPLVLLALILRRRPRGLLAAPWPAVATVIACYSGRAWRRAASGPGGDCACFHTPPHWPPPGGADLLITARRTLPAYVVCERLESRRQISEHAHT